MAIEDIDIKATISAEDLATAKIKKLADQFENLQKKLKANFGKNFKNQWTQSIGNDDIITKLEATGAAVRRLTPSYLRWARGIRDANKMNDTGFRKILNQISAIEAKANLNAKKGIGLTRKQEQNLRRLYGQAQAYQYVWNQGYMQRMGMETRLANLQAQIHGASMQRQQRAQQETRRHNDRQRREEVNWMLRSAEMRRRQRLQAFRESEALSRRRRANRTRGLRQARGHFGSALNRADGSYFNSPLFYSQIAMGATAAGAVSSFRTRMRADTAETNLRIFGGMSPQDIAAMRGDWGNSMAIKYGFSPDKMMNVATEVLKAGIPADAMKAVTETVLKSAAGLGLDESQTMKLAGRAATLTQDMKNFNPDYISKIMNGVAVAAQQTAADASEIVAANRRGAGVLSTSKMSMEDLSAFTGSGISAGLQSGRAGTFMGFLVNEIVNAKNARGQRRQDLQRGLSMVGLGGVGSASQNMANRPTETLMKMFDRMGSMSDQKRAQAANLIGMREWRDELLVMVKVRDDIARTMKAIKDNPSFLDEGSSLQTDRLEGRWNSVVAYFKLFWEKVGAGFDNIFREVSDFFIKQGMEFNGEAITKHVESALRGLLKGFGYDSITQMLNDIFGKGSSITPQSTYGFFKGLGAALREFFDIVVGIAGQIAAVGSALGMDDAETLGAFTGTLIDFANAVHFARPAFELIGVMKDTLLGLAALRFLVPGTGAAAAEGGLLAGIASLPVWAAVGGAIATGALAYFASSKGILAPPEHGFSMRGFVEMLDPGLARRIYGDDKAGTGGAISGGSGSDGLKGGAGSDTLQGGSGSSPSTGKQTLNIDGIAKRSVAASMVPNLSGLFHRSSASGSAHTGASMGMPERIQRAVVDQARAVTGAPQAAQGIRSMIQLASLQSMSGASIPGMGTSGGGSVASAFAGAGSDVANAFNPPGIGNGAINTHGQGNGIIGGGAGAAAGSEGANVPQSFGGQTFKDKAGGIVQQLQKDFGLTKEQAAGIVGNLGHESGGFRHMQEINPRGGRGGFGWAQWTGPRRRQFEAWAAANGLDPRSDAANYGFLKHELMTTQKGALAAVRGQSTAQGATVAFEQQFERAGVKSYGSRIKYANQALQLANSVPTPQSMADSVPARPAAPQGGGGGGGGAAAARPAAAPNVTIHINGGEHDTEALANKVQQRVQEAMNWRTHDMEPGIA